MIESVMRPHADPSYVYEWPTKWEISDAPPSEKNSNGRFSAFAIPLRANDVFPTPIGPFRAITFPTDEGFAIHCARTCMICVLAGAIP